MNKRKLTEKRQRFVDYFLGQAAGNATEAARLAGYKKPRQEGSDLLSNPDILSAINGHAKTTKRIADRDERQHFWSDAMRGNVDGVDRLKASELLGKSQADFIDRHKVEMSLEGKSAEEIEAATVEMFKAKPELWARIKAEVEGA